MYNRYGYGSSRESESFVMLGVMVLALFVFLLVQAVNLVRTAFEKQPQNKALWLALLLWFLSIAICAFAMLSTRSAGPGAGAADVLVGVCGVGVAITTLLLLLVSRVVTVTSQQLFSQPKEQLATRVLHRPWWTPPDAVA